MQKRMHVDASHDFLPRPGKCVYEGEWLLQKPSVSPSPRLEPSILPRWTQEGDVDVYAEVD